MKILLLGGTKEAFAIAKGLVAQQMAVVTSLAGVTETPNTPAGEVRVGGFGGVEGLVSYLTQNRIKLLIDATHPFATTISKNAANAAKQIGIARLAFHRKGWDDKYNARHITRLEDAIVFLGKVNLLALGSNQNLDFFFNLKTKIFIRRSFNRPSHLPSNCRYEKPARNPTLAQEQAILKKHKVDVLVCRNSGGDDSKLRAANALGVNIIMLKRAPPPPPPLVEDVAEVLTWARQNF